MNKQKGQVLLITVMLLATAITVVMTVAFNMTTETQITKLEEESQKALAAAEAGIEAALQQGAGSIQFGVAGPLSSLTDFSGSADIIATDNQNYYKNYFVSPLLQKDEQYTVYLANYNTALHTFSNSYNGSITVYYGSESSNCSTIAVEMILLYGAGGANIKRFIADTGSIIQGSNNEQIGMVASPAETIGNQTFNCKTNPIDISPYSQYTDAKVLVVRPLNASTKIGLTGSTTLSPQGKYIVSEAKSKTGVTKKIQLFQSYPQIPAEFFATSF